MLTTNVITKPYKIIRRNGAGGTRIDIVTAESPLAAKMKAEDLLGWEIMEVTPL